LQPTIVAPIEKGNPAYANVTLVGVDNGTHITPTLYTRTGHRAEVFYNRKVQRDFMFMFGGYTRIGIDLYLNELWALDLGIVLLGCPI